MATEVWTWQDGAPTGNGLNAVAMGPDGSSVWAGYANETTATVDTNGTLWAAAKVDPEGTVLWQWEDGSTGYTDNRIDAVAMGQDGSVALAGFAGRDCVVVKLGDDGDLLWRVQAGSSDNIYVSGVAMGGDGSVVVAGTVSGNGETTNLGGTDMAAFKLDTNGTLLWTWQNGTVDYDYANSVAVAEDGSVVLAGTSRGDFMRRQSERLDSSSSSSQWVGGDFAAIKLDPEGAEVWRWQDGASGFDKLNALSMAEKGSVVMAGYTSGDWDWEKRAGRHDFAAVKLDANGTEVWRWQGGSSEDDSLQAADVQADGTIIFGGHTEGNWSGSHTGGRDFAVVKLDQYGQEMWRWQGGSDDLEDTGWNNELNAMATGAHGGLMLAGMTYGSLGVKTLSEGDIVTAMLDTTAAITQSPTAAPSLAPDQTSPTSSMAGWIVAVVLSAVVVIALIVLGCSVRKWHIRRKSKTARQHPPHLVEVDQRNGPPPVQRNSPAQTPRHEAPVATVPPARTAPSPALPRPSVTPPPSYAHMMSSVSGSNGAGGGRDIVSLLPPAFADEVYSEVGVSTHAGKRGGGGGNSGRGAARAEGDSADNSSEPTLIVTSSTADTSTGERDGSGPTHGGGGTMGTAFVAEEPKPTPDELRAWSSTDKVGSPGNPNLNETGTTSSAGCRRSSGVIQLGQVVGAVAKELAENCVVPGVSEAAAAVSILVNLLNDNRDNKKGTDASLKRCRSIIMMLQRAAEVLGKAGETHGKAERVMLEDVHDAIFDLVELVKTYQSKNKLSQLLMSTLFKRRQEEMGAVVDRAILRLQLGLHVQIGTDVRAVKQDVSSVKEEMNLYQSSIDGAKADSVAEARMARRQRKLDKIEIPEDHVTITDELLGKGGFGEVYLADYNGRNAAAKVMYISHELGTQGEKDVLDVSRVGKLKQQREESQRKAFLRELDAMIHLRSPYTVNVYGAVTSQPDRLVLVMELLAGGDLRTLLKNPDVPLSDDRSRQLVGDICAGMAFLHNKKTVHGDLKSANVLLDSAGRAKIGDFGTSRWTQHTMSTGLATFTTKSSKNTQMSLAWSAPEVLDAAGSTYASDVYSFGVVVWELLSRELPWATVAHPKEIYIRVVLKDLRPDIPGDAPTDIADVARACWVGDPEKRPTFRAILEGMKPIGINV